MTKQRSLPYDLRATLSPGFHKPRAPFNGQSTADGLMAVSEKGYVREPVDVQRAKVGRKDAMAMTNNTKIDGHFSRYQESNESGVKEGEGELLNAGISIRHFGSSEGVRLDASFVTAGGNPCDDFADQLTGGPFVSHVQMNLKRQIRT